MVLSLLYAGSLRRGHICVNEAIYGARSYSSILFITNDELALKQNLGLKS